MLAWAVALKVAAAGLAVALPRGAIRDALEEIVADPRHARGGLGGFGAAAWPGSGVRLGVGVGWMAGARLGRLGLADLRRLAGAAGGIGWGAAAVRPTSSTNSTSIAGGSGALSTEARLIDSAAISAT